MIPKRFFSELVLPLQVRMKSANQPMVAVTCSMRSSALTQICTLLISCMKELSVEATKFGIIFCRSRQSRPSPRFLQNLHEGSVLAHPHYTPLSTRRLLITHGGFRKHSRDSAASNNLFCARRLRVDIFQSLGMQFFFTTCNTIFTVPFRIAILGVSLCACAHLGATCCVPKLVITVLLL